MGAGKNSSPFLPLEQTVSFFFLYIMLCKMTHSSDDDGNNVI